MTTAKEKIITEAGRLGFSFAGVSRAGFLEEEASRLERWLREGRHGTMSYMERNFDKRLDPRLLVEGARTVISLLMNYFPATEQPTGHLPIISRYAYGKDYHLVIKDKLKELIEFIRSEIGEVNGRAFTDSAPVLDKAWAAKSGLGWIGKNGNLIHPKSGSWFFIAELITDLDLEPDSPISDYCGTCTACIDACPTAAIIQPKVVDGSRCISYFTIELKEAIPESVRDDFQGRAFGCDICQEVCPWNRFAIPTTIPEFTPKKEILEFNTNDWLEITEEVFKERFRDSPLSRTGREGMIRNVKFVTGEK